MNEFELIDKIRSRFHQSVPWMTLGIGDDCAALSLKGLSLPNGTVPQLRGSKEGPVAEAASGPPHDNLILTVDSLVEDRHFTRSILSAEDTGKKAAYSAASDIAAMGASPRVLLIALHLPKSIDDQWVDSLLEGLKIASLKVGAVIAGGNISASREVVISVTVIGTSSGGPLLRSSARPGDDIWVTGRIGLAALGLTLLLEPGSVPSCPEDLRTAAVKRYGAPVPRTDVGAPLLLWEIATSAIDISDGFLQDLSHILSASEVAAELDEALLCRTSVPTEVYPLHQSLSGGGDYELIFTAPASRRHLVEELNSQLDPDSRASRVGEILPNKAQPPGQILVRRAAGGSIPASALWGGVGGYDHFR